MTVVPFALEYATVIGWQEASIGLGLRANADSSINPCRPGLCKGNPGIVHVSIDFSEQNVRFLFYDWLRCGKIQPTCYIPGLLSGLLSKLLAYPTRSTGIYPGKAKRISHIIIGSDQLSMTDMCVS